jgi:ATP/maltotriose-dependent transcriptional regulator MalT
MEKFIRTVVEPYAVPIIMTAAYLFLLEASDPSGLAKVLLGCAFAGVILTWVAFRELRAHANASRAAAIGLADELIASANAQIDRRMFARSRAPFLVYLGIGHHLRGDFDMAITVLDRADAERALKPVWQLLAATTRLAILVERGEAAPARALYDRGIGPATQRMAGPGPRLMGEEALARVRFAEGDHAAAAPMFTKMSGDVRLGPATRAFAHYYAARCAAARGDLDLAERRFQDAAKLAPGTYAARRPASA